MYREGRISLRSFFALVEDNVNLMGLKYIFIRLDVSGAHCTQRAGLHSGKKGQILLQAAAVRCSVIELFSVEA